MRVPGYRKATRRGKRPVAARIDTRGRRSAIKAQVGDINMIIIYPACTMTLLNLSVLTSSISSLTRSGVVKSAWTSSVSIALQA